MRRLHLFTLMLVLGLAGCATPILVPMPPAETSLPPTAVATPIPTQAMQMPTTAAAMPMTPSAAAKPGKVSVGGGFYTNISPEDLYAMLDKKDFVLINVHVPYAGEIANTDLFIPWTEIEKSLDKLPKDKNAKLVLYCRSSMMSTPASEALVKLGFTNVLNLMGGMNAWTAKQYPLLNKPK